MQEDVRRYLQRIKAWLSDQLAKFTTPAEIPVEALVLASDWDDELKSLASENYRRVATAMKPKIEQRLKRAGIDYSLNMEDPRLKDFINAKTLKVVDINDGIRDGLRETLAQAQSENLTINELQEEVYSVMQDSRARALRIARTETASAANGTEYVAHNIAGVKEHMWLAAMDEHTRDTHLACMREGLFRLQGILKRSAISWRPDGPPEEVCNCRCTLIPVE